MKKEYALNKHNIAHLGVCEEFHTLYQSVVDLYNDASESVKKNNTKGLVSIDKLERECWSQTRKLFDDFLIKHTILFTAKYKSIHPNAEALRKMQLIEVKRTAPLKLIYSVIPFNTFVERFQDFVCDILTRRESYEKPYISREYVWNELNAYINTLAEKEIEKTVKKGILENAKELIVYKNLNAISCNRDDHEVLPDRITVSVIGKEYAVVLPVHRCKDCGKVFVGYETLKVYEKEYGQLFIVKNREDDAKGVVYQFESESPLHRAGYNVVEGMMTEEQRRALLTTFLKTETFSHFEICRDIENAIKIFDGQARYVNAVSKWKSDLMFIGEFVKEEMVNNEN